MTPFEQILLQIVGGLAGLAVGVISLAFAEWRALRKAGRKPGGFPAFFVKFMQGK